MLSWVFNDDPINLWQPHLQPELPYELKQALPDPSIIKCGWNAGTFERTVLNRLLKIHVPTSQFCDVMVWARHLSMPGSLESIGPILKLSVDEQKMDEGRRLIKKFSEPQGKVTISPLFGGSTAFFRDWDTDPEDWALFGEYCVQDTFTERLSLKKIERFFLPEIEQRGWILDQQINDLGMPVDMSLVHGALGIALEEQTSLNQQLSELTSLENPNSRDQMLGWVRAEGYRFNSLGKEEVARALAEKDYLTPKGRAALELRQKASKTSYKKYEAILLNVSSDHRLRHQFSFLGASRAGRWSGHSVQLHNLARPVKAVEKRMDRAVELLRAGDGVTLAQEFPSVKDAVVSCIRAAFRAPEGKKLIVCDLNAIENRVLGWIARSNSILKVFELGRDPYLDFAAILFNIPYAVLEASYKNGDPTAKEMRQLAKPAVLGCGYGLGGGEEFINKDGDTVKGGLWGYAEGMNIMMSRAQAHKAVKVYRDANDEVVRLWNDLETAAMLTVMNGDSHTVGPVKFECFGGKLLRILLPSGRGLHYIHPKIETREFPGKGGRESYTKDTLYYDGIDQTTRQWIRVPTYGGKLTENIDQAIARDILLNAMFLADEMGFDIVGHCHDEIITEEDNNSVLTLKELRDCMMARPKWAPDLPLGAEGYEGIYYKKG